MDACRVIIVILINTYCIEIPISRMGSLLLLMRFKYIIDQWGEPC